MHGLRSVRTLFAEGTQRVHIEYAQYVMRSLRLVSHSLLFVILSLLVRSELFLGSFEIRFQSGNVNSLTVRTLNLL